MKILIDGQKINSRLMLHTELLNQGGFPSYYGKNLDALYDLLTTSDQQYQFEFKNLEDLYHHLGHYCKSFFYTIEEAMLENDKIEVNIKE